MAFEPALSPSPSHVVAGTVALFTLLLWHQRRTSKQQLPYPPGPPPLPLIGNVLDMPQSKFALTWTEYAEKYGPLTWLRIPGQNFLIISSIEATVDLMENKALNFIDRPRFTMVRELLGLDGYSAFNDCNSTLKTQRTLLKHPLSAIVVKRDYSALLELKARQYLERCLNRPEDFFDEINQVVVEGIIQLTYGRLDDGQGTDYYKLNTEIGDIVLESTEPGYAVDIVPARMKFKRDAAVWKNGIRELERNLLKSSKQSLNSGDPDVRSSFMFKKLQELYQDQDSAKTAKQLEEDEMSLMRAGLTMFVAGGETTRNTVETFVRAMSLFPAVQKVAQAEIDSVVGFGRFPNFEDQPHMPYTYAVMLETMRWCPTTAFGTKPRQLITTKMVILTTPAAGLPHVSREDEIYNGYFIPKGTAVAVNTWGISQDPKYYLSPSDFNPDRYLKTTPELDPMQYAFGHGRRISPGKELAVQQIWIMIVSILWGFNLVAAEEEDLTAWRHRITRFSFSVLK
ncbi:hypothetical protein FRB90_004578 [Tulasnella sp. 427]|nr:hypothetical protein FRB90_004578 [Tulasnella sp. 427]